MDKDAFQKMRNGEGESPQWRPWDALGDAVIVIDEGGTIRYANQATRDIFGYGDAPLEGKPMLALQSPRVDEIYRVAIASDLEPGNRRAPRRNMTSVGLRADGSEFPIELSLGEVDADAGRRFVLIVRDASERKRSEDALKAAISQLTATLESTNDGILVVGDDDSISRFNQRFVDMWEIPPEVLETRDNARALGFVLQQLTDPAAFMAKVEALKANRPAESFDILHFKDGRVYERLSRPQIEDGTPVGRVWSFRDVSLRIRSESRQAALHKISEAAHSALDLRDLFQRIHEIISELLPARNFYVALYDNSTDLISFPYFIDEFDPQPQPRLLETDRGLTAEVLRTGEPLLLTPSTSLSLVPDPGPQYVGTYGVDWLGVPLKTARGTIGVLTVQTYSGSERYTERDTELLQFVSDQVAAAVERTQAQQAVRESGERFRSVFDQSPIAMFLLSHPEERFHEVNAVGLQAFGFTREEMIGRTASELNAWVDPSQRVKYLERLGAEGSVQNFETVLRRHDGVTFTVLFSASLVTLDAKAYSLNSIQDISERKFAEASLRASEEQFKNAFEHSAIGMALVSLEGSFLDVNSGLCSILGYSEEELLRRTFQDITHPEDLAADLEHLRALLAGETKSYTMEKRYFRRDGSIVPVLLAVTLVRDPAGAPKHFISQVEDIGERKRAERWQQHYSDTLELITAEAALPIVLDSLARFAEQQAEGMLCSILLLSRDGKHLHSAAGPSLPAFFTEAINGAEVSLQTGSCGAAAASGQTVVVEDITTHPSWAPWREVAARAGVRACWSHPIQSADNKVLGTFALYRREPAAPDAKEIELIRQSASLAAVALERAQHNEDRRLAKVVFEQSVEGIMVTDLEDTVLMVNQSFESLTGFPSAQVVGRSPAILDPGREDLAVRVLRREALASTGRWNGEAWGRKQSGEIYPMAMSIAAVMDANGRPSYYISIVTDISDQKIQAARIEQLAFYDSLTGLPNRALFLDRLEQTLVASKRHGGHGALLFLDLDRFKEINDSQGHAVGDLALVEVAQRFQRAARKEETLARLGGDEFVLIAENADVQAAVRIATRLQQALVQPLDLLGQPYSVGASIGIAFYPVDGETSEDLIKRTDIAMYRAKASGGGYRLYQAEMGAQLDKRLAIAKSLSRAMEAGKLQLYYQPQIELNTNTLVGAEALLRWNDPVLGWISPGEFIPIAEERGMMGPLGDWVLREACRQVTEWSERGTPLPGRLAINVSAQQIEHPDIVARLLGILHEAKLSPGHFELELTESSMMIDPEQAVQIMQLLRDAGFGLSIDDFGTGYSSLSYLKRFSADHVKIDISFVRNMLTDANDHTIVTTIIAMARSLGLKTTAEGVEEPGQAAALRVLGCDSAQGYHFGRPEPPEAFAARWLAHSPGFVDPTGTAP